MARAGLSRWPIGRRVRWPLLASAILLFGAGVLAAAHTLPLRAGDGPETFCERTRASFERTGKLARDLVVVLESLDAEGPAATAEHLAAKRQAFEYEALVLQTLAIPSGAEEVQARGQATLDLLIGLADPRLLEAEPDGRADLAQYLREQLLAARNEARAAATALRQSDGACAAYRAEGGVIRLLRRHS